MTAVPDSTARPSTVNASYWLYIAGAVLGLIGLVVSLATLPLTLAQIQQQAGVAVQGQDTNGVDVAGVATGAAIGTVVAAAVLTLIYSILFIVFANKMRQGRNWARIVLIVLAALQVLGVAGSYGVGALHFLVVLAALVLSVVPASNAWFRAMSPRPATV